MNDLAPVIENSPVYPDSDAFLSAHRTVPRPLIGLRTLLDSHMKTWDEPVRSIRSYTKHWQMKTRVS